MPSAARAAYSSADVLVRRRPYRRGAPRRFARGMDRARRPDARHGRGSGDGSRLTRLVPRRLGDDDGGDDAALGRADGGRVHAGETPRASRNDVLPRRLSRRVDGLRSRRVRDLPRLAGGGAGGTRVAATSRPQRSPRPACTRSRRSSHSASATAGRRSTSCSAAGDPVASAPGGWEPSTAPTASAAASASCSSCSCSA